MSKKKENDKEQRGTPTMVMLPARNYRFKVVVEKHKIVIPRKGSYTDLDPEFFDKADGEFDILANKNKVLYMPAISKVLFGAKLYPDLKPAQLYAPVAFSFTKDSVEITGQVLEMLPPK
jgi:hypothetical protein